MKYFNRLLISLLIVAFAFGLTMAEEGMYPLSEIHKLDLQKKGLQISPQEIYNPNDISIIDAICIVGRGCTGSFVSEDGLILTNHHCAYGAVQSASTKEKDYIKDGFIAQSREEEIIAKGYTIRITESYEDVSQKVLNAVSEKMTLVERSKAIEKKIKQIEKEAEDKNPGKRADVSEMFKGKTYVLFIYTNLKDVRMVYIPPHSIGNFGGEIDNWEWPRHTGDFSFLRVYVAPDGSSAEYSEDNIPYQPKKFLQVAPDGINEEDFAFILGYPGSTYRPRTSHFLSYDEEVYMPYVIDFYDWMIETMEKISESDRAVALKHLNTIERLANVSKKYKGRLQGLDRLNRVSKKMEEEKTLQEFIEADANRKDKYGNTLTEISEIYKEKRLVAERELILYYFKYHRSSKLLRYAYTIYEGAIEREKDDLDRKSDYMDKNFKLTKKYIMLSYNDYYEATDKIILREMFLKAANLLKRNTIPAISKIIEGKNKNQAIDEFIENAYKNTKLTNEEFLKKYLNASKEEVEKLDDPFIKLAKELYPTYQELDDIQKARKGSLDKLAAKLIDVKKQYKGKDFIPDANFTLRFTYGYIRGYTPRDAVYCSPITTVNGILEKNTGNDPFNAPPKVLELIKKEDFGRFRHPKYNSVPVGILYDMDTTGGNSGSPVLNAKGELVGLNFDRAFEATINDYYWSKEYSRSIGVDIRYILWILQKYGEVDYLLKEMNIE
ncbi:MAG: S46 family peptidase [Calditrichia bacterium]|nr:S46 family peptidase [Calditrichia bacterium]